MSTTNEGEPKWMWRIHWRDLRIQAIQTRTEASKWMAQAAGEDAEADFLERETITEVECDEKYSEELKLMIAADYRASKKRAVDDIRARAAAHRKIAHDTIKYEAEPYERQAEELLAAHTTT